MALSKLGDPDLESFHDSVWRLTWLIGYQLQVKLLWSYTEVGCSVSEQLLPESKQLIAESQAVCLFKPLAEGDSAGIFNRSNGSSRKKACLKKKKKKVTYSFDIFQTSGLRENCPTSCQY